MHKAVPTVGFIFGYALLAGRGSAISAEAQAATNAASAVVASPERSQALFGEKLAAISSLQALARECGQEGWDGNDAAGIAPFAVHAAESLLRALPPGVPLPELAPEPDGSLSLDWIRSRTRLFSL